MTTRTLARTALLVVLALAASGTLTACTAGSGAPAKATPATTAPLRAPVAVPSDMAKFAYDSPQVAVAVTSNAQIAAVSSAMAKFPVQVTIVTVGGKQSVVATWAQPATTAQVAALAKTLGRLLPKAALTRATVAQVGFTLSAPAPAGFGPAAKTSLATRLETVAGVPLKATVASGVVSVIVIAHGLTLAAKATLVTTMAATLGVPVAKVTITKLAAS